VWYEVAVVVGSGQERFWEALGDDGDALKQAGLGESHRRDDTEIGGEGDVVSASMIDLHLDLDSLWLIPSMHM
jgi:hypothetical protein